MKCSLIPSLVLSHVESGETNDFHLRDWGHTDWIFDKKELETKLCNRVRDVKKLWKRHENHLDISSCQKC